jgi:hypothetical protein
MPQLRMQIIAAASRATAASGTAANQRIAI